MLVDDSTGMLYLEAGINARYFALTNNAVYCSSVSLYDLKAI